MPLECLSASTVTIVYIHTTQSYREAETDNDQRLLWRTLIQPELHCLMDKTISNP